MRKTILISVVCFVLLGITISAGRILSVPGSVTQGDKKEKMTRIDLPKLEDPRLVITKSERRLEVFDSDKLVKTYKIGLGSSPVGDKEIEGDGKTPEGEFYIFIKNPKSSFYLSLGLSYPNSEDAERGLKEKLISKSEYDAIVGAIKNKKTPPQKTSLGGEIYLHGHGSGSDWTAGCVALSNADIKELFDELRLRTPVLIKP